MLTSKVPSSSSNSNSTPHQKNAKRREDYLAKGSFFNYVDQIMPIIDHQSTPVNIGDEIT